MGEMPPSFSYRVRFVCDLMTQWQNVHLLAPVLCRHVTSKDDRVTIFYTLWTTPSVTIARNSSAHVRSSVHAHSTEFQGRKFQTF